VDALLRPEDSGGIDDVDLLHHRCRTLADDGEELWPYGLGGVVWTAGSPWTIHTTG
jgi:hypothetical protein